MAQKLFYSMGEVAEMFDVRPSLLRYWEEHIPQLRPKRTGKGNRRYTEKDIELIKTIYHLVKERGMRIEGATKALRQQRRTGEVADNAALLEHLQRIRALLVEVREELNSGEEAILTDEEPTSGEPQPAPTIDKGGKAVVSIPDEPTDPTRENDEKPKVRRPRRKKENEEKELFAFYEQSLF